MKLETTVTADKDSRSVTIAQKVTADKGIILWSDVKVYEESLLKNALVHLGWTPPATTAYKPPPPKPYSGDPNKLGHVICDDCHKKMPYLSTFAHDVSSCYPPGPKSPTEEIIIGPNDGVPVEVSDKKNHIDPITILKKMKGDPTIWVEHKSQRDIMVSEAIDREETSDSKRAHMAYKLREQGFSVEQVFKLMGIWEEAELLAKPSPETNWLEIDVSGEIGTIGETLDRLNSLVGIKATLIPESCHRIYDKVPSLAKPSPVDK